jgi:Tfp pilus assembly protein PilZ
MAKRRSVRRPRRVQVQFWRRGEPQANPGYTTNISTTGMFLATNSPQPPGTRLRIEVLEGSHAFMVEGVVAHSRKIRGDLIRMSHPGMGVRFLSVEELVREVIPMLPGETEEIPETDRDWGHGAPARTKPLPQHPEPPAPARPSPTPEPVAPRLATPPPPQPAEPVPRPSEGTGAFSLEFAGPADFLLVYQRDIVNGGLFVPTRYPGRLQETVRINLVPPLPGAQPVPLRARVVQRTESQGSGGGQLAGMGVEILDLPSVVERLLPLVQRLQIS